MSFVTGSLGALEDHNPPAVGSTHEEVIVPRVAQRCDVLRRRCPDFLCFQVLPVKERGVIDVEHEEVLCVELTTGFSVGHREIISTVGESYADTVGDIESSCEAIERMIKTNFPAG